MSINAYTVETLLDCVDDMTNSNGAVTASAKEVKTLFEDYDYYNAGSEGKDELQDQIDRLQSAIESLQKEAEDLQDEIKAANLEVDDESDNLADIVSKINDATGDYKEEVKAAIKETTSRAIQDYQKNGGSFETWFKQAWARKSFGAELGSISNLYSEFDSTQSSISGVLSTIEGYLDDIDGLQSKLNNTNATINLLTTTMNNMTDTIEGAYSNNDTDTSVPVYSGAKAELADEILGNYTSRYESSVSSLTTETSSDTITEEQQAVMDNWLSQKTGTYRGGDQYNVATNPELANLRSLYEAGMLDDLQNSGLNAEQILTFVSTNWNVGVSEDSEGTWTIPNGHSKDAYCSEPVFNALTALATNNSTNATADDIDQNQMEELKKAVLEDNIIEQMYNSGYSFKEAMYLLTQAFPDAGITYDLSTQDEGKSYGLVEDSDLSGSLYSTISSQILEYWNVGANGITIGDDSTSGNVNKTDPITFQDGNVTYTFITDRNGDGDFDYTDGANNDLLGSKEGMAELFEYDYNGDGYIDDNDIATDSNGKTITVTDPDGTERKLTALDQLTLMSNNQIENYEDEDGDGYGDVNTVDFDVTYSSAREAGITSINLSNLSESDTGKGDEITSSTKDYDNVQEEFEDINGSSIINQFTITKNGKKITANETLNTEENLETFYGQVADNAGAIYSSIDDADYAFNDTDQIDSTLDMLDGLEDTLEDARDAAEDIEDYSLSITEDEFIEKYGTDGKSGEYAQDVYDAALDAAKNDISDTNTALKAVDKAVDKVNSKSKYNDEVEIDD